MQHKRICLAAALAAVVCGGVLLSETASAEEAEVQAVAVATATTSAGMVSEEPAVAEELYGWQTEDGVRRYYDENGTAVTGVQTIDGVSYLFDYKGVQKTGWRTVKGIRQYFDPETGEPVSGWVDYCGLRYYTDEEDGKQTGEITVDGKRYLLEEHGWQQTGFCTFADGVTSYYAEDFEAVTGWETVNSRKYYFDGEGAMQTGWQTIGGSRYYLGSDGAAQTGMRTVDGSRYYFNADGKMQTGLQSVNGSRYYFGSDGKMKTGWQDVGSSRYYFQSDGTMVTDWQMIGGKLYYFNSVGVMQKNQEIYCYYDENHWGDYYLQSDGTAISMVAYRLNQASLSPHDTVVVYNRQSASHTQWTSYLSAADKQTLQKFINQHFTASMTREDKLWTALNWIHSNVDYAYVENGAWAQISNKTYVDAIFNYRKGQCLQYNMAMAAMMAYLGYDVNLVQGYVGGVGNQHFWCEVHINGKTYVMETGNEGKNGSWMHFLDSYDVATEYVQY